MNETDTFEPVPENSGTAPAASSADGNDTLCPHTTADRDPADPVETDPRDDLASLRRELNEMRAEIAAHGERFAGIDREYADFHRLFPDTPLDDLPDGVWTDVKNGVPLAAAYALAERRARYAERLAAENDARNRTCSAGAVHGGDAGEFTREEVMAMSADEVRANYEKIRQSMSKWH